MIKTLFVIPKKGLLVLRPDTGAPLQMQGEPVPKTTYWLRRLKSGDVTLGNVPAHAPTKSKKE